MRIANVMEEIQDILCDRVRAVAIERRKECTEYHEHRSIVGHSKVKMR
jgi:hypothetical protein